MKNEGENAPIRTTSLFPSPPPFLLGGHRGPQGPRGPRGLQGRLGGTDTCDLSLLYTDYYF